MQMPPRFPDERDAQQLGSRLLRPRRARLKEARTALAGVTEPREAWEALASREIVPLSWVGASERTFRNGWMRMYPPTVEAALMLGSDAEGVLTAEALVRECAARLAELGYPTTPAAPVQWWMVPPSRNTRALQVDGVWWELGRFARASVNQLVWLKNVPPEDRTSTALFRGASEGRTLVDPRRGPSPGAEVVGHFVDAAMRSLWSARAWYLAARDGILLPARRAWGDEAPPARDASVEGVTRDGAWAGRAIGEAPDPFDPLLRLWATGYAPGSLDGGLTLFALDRPA